MNDKAISLEFTSKEIQSIDKMNAKLNEFAKEIGMSDNALKLFEKALVSTVSTMSKVKVTSPFSRLAEDTAAAKTALTSLNRDLKETSTLMLKGLTLKKNAGFRELVTDTKAVLVVHQQINSEIEKQAALKAMLLTIKGTSDSAKALTASKAETAELEKQVEVATVLNAQLDKVGSRKLNQGSNQAALNKDAKMIDAQVAALDKLQTRLRSLKGSSNLPTAEFNNFRKTIAEASTAIQQSGKSQKGTIAVTSMLIGEHEKLAAAEKKAATAAKEMSTAQANYAREAMTGTAAAEKLLNIKRMTASESTLLKNQMIEEAAMQDKLARASMTGVAAAERLLGIKRMSATESSKIKTQMEEEVAAAERLNTINYKLARSYGEVAVGASKASTAIMSMMGGQSKQQVMPTLDTSRINAQASAMANLTDRFSKLSAMKIPSAKLNKLKDSLHNLNLEFAQTGKVSKKGLTSFITEMTKLEMVMKKSSKTTKDWGKSMKFAIGGVARSMGAMTYSYSMLLPLIAGMAAGGAVKKIYELGAAFEYTTTYVDNLSSSIGGIDVTRLQSGLLDLVKDDNLRTGPEDLAEGMKEFAKAGVGSSEALEQIGEMSKFAKVAQLGLAEAVKLTIGQSKAFGVTYVEAANMIGVAALNSATDISELGNALSYTTELAEVSKVDFHEVATAMAVMANAGIRGSKAGTAIRTSILKMQAPSEKLKKQLDDLGVSWGAFTEGGQVKDLRTMFTELKDATDKLPNKQRISVLKELFGLRALKGGANILKSQGAEWDNLSAKIQAANGELSFVELQYGQLADTVTAYKDRLAASSEVFLIEGNDSSYVKTMLDDLEAVVSSTAMSDLRDAVIEVINVLGVGLTGTIRLVTELYDTLDGGLPRSLSDFYHMMSNLSPNDTVSGWFEAFGNGFGYVEEKAKAAYVAALNLVKTQPFLFEQSEKFNIPFAATPEDSTRIIGPLQPSEKELQYMEDVRIEAEFARDTVELLYSQMSQEIATSNLTKWEKALAEAEEKARKHIAEIEKSRGVKIGAVDAEGVVQSYKDNLVAQKIKEIDAVISELNMDEFNAGLAQSEDIVSRVFGTFSKIRDDVYQTMAEAGQASKDDEGEFIFTKKGKEYLDTMLSSAKAFSGEFKSLLSKGGITAVEEAIKQLGESTIPGAAEAAEAFAKALDSVKAEGLIKIKDSIEELDFKQAVQSLKDSDSLSEQLAGSLLEAKKKAYETVKALHGISGAFGDMKFNSPEAEKYFNMLVSGAAKSIFSIKELKKDLDATKLSFQDMEFGLKLEGMDDAGKNKALKTRVAELKELSKQAGEAGLEGRKKEIEYLKQARALILEMNTDQKAVTKEQAQKAYDAYAARYKAVRGGVQKNDPELLRLAAESRRLTKLYQDKEADPQAVKKANDEKLRLLKEVNKAQLEAQKKQIDGMESMKQSVLDAGTNFMANAKTAGEIFKGVVESTILPGAGTPSAGTPSAGVMKGVQDSASTAFTDQTAVFNTALSDEEAAKFEVWLTDISNSLGRDLARDLADYDLQGYWKEEVSKGVREGIKEGAHFPDTFKKPGHPTFSDESKYSVDGRSGGKWGEGSFAPSKDQLAAGWDTTQMKEYFATAEEGVKVLKGGIIEVTQAQSSGEMTDSGLVINLKDTTEAAKEAKETMNRLYDSPVSGGTFEEFIAGLKETKEEAKRVASETKRLKLLEINPDEVKKASGVMKAEAKTLQEAFLASGKLIAEVREGIVDKTNSMTGLTPEQTAKAEEELAKLKDILAKAEELHNKDAEALSGFIDLLKSSQQGTEAMSKGVEEAEEDVKELNKELEKTNDLISNMPKLNVGSGSGSIEARAMGGPVSAGQSYLVGEVGAELFTPNTSGYITPNNKLSGNKNSVDINLSINGSDPIPLQGSQQSVEDLTRAFEDKRRFAA